ncbi:MAG TPA: hypothetical protein VGL26_11290, partial [Jatrophihabitans sp.]
MNQSRAGPVVMGMEDMNRCTVLTIAAVSAGGVVLAACGASGSSSGQSSSSSPSGPSPSSLPESSPAS